MRNKILKIFWYCDVAWILILIEQGLDDRHLMDLGFSTESLEGLGLRHIYIYPVNMCLIRSFFPLG
jgi:hypothetical protein